tara:strand:- start:101 stop:451 length:351 start_codon:yes stop_codon:yes gene_type:complete
LWSDLKIISFTDREEEDTAATMEIVQAKYGYDFSGRDKIKDVISSRMTILPKGYGASRTYRFEIILHELIHGTVRNANMGYPEFERQAIYGSAVLMSKLGFAPAGYVAQGYGLVKP